VMLRWSSTVIDSLMGFLLRAAWVFDPRFVTH